MCEIASGWAEQVDSKEFSICLLDCILNGRVTECKGAFVRGVVMRVSLQER